LLHAEQLRVLFAYLSQVADAVSNALSSNYRPKGPRLKLWSWTASMPWFNWWAYLTAQL